MFKKIKEHIRYIVIRKKVKCKCIIEFRKERRKIKNRPKGCLGPFSEESTKLFDEWDKANVHFDYFGLIERNTKDGKRDLEKLYWDVYNTLDEQAPDPKFEEHKKGMAELVCDFAKGLPIIHK